MIFYVNYNTKRNTALDTLFRDHHNGLITARLIKKNSPENPNLPKTIEGKRDYVIRFYQDELIRHFLNEEKILFPAVKGKASEIDNIILELTDDHRKIENLIDVLLTGKNVENILNILGVTLEVHIIKEEKILFKIIQVILSKEELNNIGEILSKTLRTKNGE